MEADDIRFELCPQFFRTDQFERTNLANVFYVSGQNGNNEFYGAPREFGLRLGYRF